MWKGSGIIILAGCSSASSSSPSSSSHAFLFLSISSTSIGNANQSSVSLSRQPGQQYFAGSWAPTSIPQQLLQRVFLQMSQRIRPNKLLFLEWPVHAFLPPPVTGPSQKIFTLFLALLSTASRFFATKFAFSTANINL